jgi:1-acyl-sn-glycerol-3-phosphate acyltransferase
MLFSIFFVAYFWISSFFLFLINCVICLCVAPFDPLRRAVHTFSNHWGNHYFLMNPGWKMTYEGLEYIDPNKTYVLVSNHQSLADILLLYGLHRYYKWVSKEEVFKTPIIGWNMTLNQYVLIRRGDMKSIKEMMNTSKNWLKKGASLMIFPEGTRSRDGEIQAFRDGAFRLAVDTKVPLVPIVVDGTGDLLPKGSLSLSSKVHLRVKILPPVTGEQFDNSSGKMRTYVHGLMVDTLAQMRGKTPPAPTEIEDASGSAPPVLKDKKDASVSA